MDGTKPLAGLRIVDFSRLLPGPFGTWRLAQLGAEVLKVEDVRGGDPMRLFGPPYDAVNRGKQSVALDLREETGRRQALALIRAADVCIESYRPGVMKAMGLDEPSVRPLNPRLIYCSVTGYGQEGPWADLAGHDINYLSVTGVTAVTGVAIGDEEHLAVPGITVADYAGGVAVVEAVLAALWRRERTGQGAYLDVAMQDMLLSFQAVNGALARAGVPTGPEKQELNGGVVCYHLYRAKDGWVSLGALEQKFWDRFCQGVGRPQWRDKSRSPACSENPVYREMVELFRSRPRDEWATLGEQWDCCLMPVLTVPEVVERFSDHPAFRPGKGPALGEHTWPWVREALASAD
ncbi:CaiB/BaiF CoA transferase family protein [Kyrpidia spormannii]|uniref:CaiB/BaiF CoA transferase family protein n=1 Tax=Kyrpidia spormannii TaxID=2055160 RepID=UPI0012FFD86D|nr:CoA transferase [Kyrpidia spormannii]